MTAIPGHPNRLDAAVAQKLLQEDFDPQLARLLDGFNQSSPHEVELSRSESMALSVNRLKLNLFQPMLTNDAGLMRYGDASKNVTLARPVAVAATARGANDVEAIVRLRSIGTDALSLSFYRVDDLTGSISGVAPGSDHYADLVASRLYSLGTGGTSIANPSLGEFAQTTLQGVNQGDLIAMRLTNTSLGRTFWPFANQNTRSNPIAPLEAEHNSVQLMNYGLNTWGWEERPSGKIADFNDLIVGLDFTSTAGSSWLV